MSLDSVKMTEVITGRERRGRQGDSLCERMHIAAHKAKGDNKART